jgi:peptidoglycan/LPS O-acetylase OafA/YrhL
MQRPAGARTHLGRLVEQVRGEGPSALTSVVQRKLEMNLASVASSIWRFLVPIALAFLAYLAFAGARPLRDLVRRIPPLASALAGFAVLLVLGYALNDTGIMVPALMLGMLVPVVSLLIVGRSHSERPEPDKREREATAPGATA